MARTRLIHPGASIEEDVATMSIAARLLWAYLPCHADREGRLKDSPFTIKAAVFPADAIDVNALLDELARAKHIIRYQVDDKRVIQIRSFRKYQSPHRNESESSLPPPPTHDDSRTVVTIHECSLPSVSVSGIGSGDVSSESLPPPAIPGAGTTAIWSADDWLARFKVAFQDANKGIFYGRGAGDGRALGTLQASLDALPCEGRIAAQLRAPLIFEEFLGDRSPKAVAEKYQFSYFVLLFNGLRTPPKEAAARAGPTRDVRHGHARAEDSKHLKTGEVKL